LREFTYRYAFLPHTGKWEEAKLYNEALAFNAPLKVCQLGKQEGMFETEQSFVSIDADNLILSSVTKSDNDTVLIRVYNPTDHEIKGKINTSFEFKTAQSVRLDGKVRETLHTENGSIEVVVGKGKIYTVELL